MGTSDGGAEGEGFGLGVSPSPTAVYPLGFAQVSPLL